MKSKRKLAVMVSSLALVVFASAVAIVAILAATRQNVSSGITINYVATNVSAELKARYWVAGQYDDGERVWVDLGYDNNSDHKTITYLPTDSGTRSFDRPAGAAESGITINASSGLSSTNNYVIFEYAFKNISEDVGFSVVNGFTPVDQTNMDLKYYYSYEPITDFTEEPDIVYYVKTGENSTTVIRLVDGNYYEYSVVNGVWTKSDTVYEDESYNPTNDGFSAAGSVTNNVTWESDTNALTFGVPGTGTEDGKYSDLYIYVKISINNVANNANIEGTFDFTLTKKDMVKLLFDTSEYEVGVIYNTDEFNPGASAGDLNGRTLNGIYVAKDTVVNIPNPKMRLGDFGATYVWGTRAETNPGSGEYEYTPLTPYTFTTNTILYPVQTNESVVETFNNSEFGTGITGKLIANRGVDNYVLELSGEGTLDPNWRDNAGFVDQYAMGGGGVSTRNTIGSATNVSDEPTYTLQEIRKIEIKGTITAPVDFGMTYAPAMYYYSIDGEEVYVYDDNDDKYYKYDKSTQIIDKTKEVPTFYHKDVYVIDETTTASVYSKVGPGGMYYITEPEQDSWYYVTYVNGRYVQTNEPYTVVNGTVEADGFSETPNVTVHHYYTGVYQYGSFTYDMVSAQKVLYDGSVPTNQIGMYMGYNVYDASSIIAYDPSVSGYKEVEYGYSMGGYYYTITNTTYTLKGNSIFEDGYEAYAEGQGPISDQKYYPLKNYAMFAGLTNLEEFVITGTLDTSRAETMAGLFDGCVKLKYLDLHTLDTSRVVSMREMFASCRELETIVLGTYFNGNTSLIRKDAEHFYYYTYSQENGLQRDVNNAEFTGDLSDLVAYNYYLDTNNNNAKVLVYISGGYYQVYQNSMSSIQFGETYPDQTVGNDLNGNGFYQNNNVNGTPIYGKSIQIITPTQSSYTLTETYIEDAGFYYNSSDYVWTMYTENVIKYDTDGWYSYSMGFEKGELYSSNTEENVPDGFEAMGVQAGSCYSLYDETTHNTIYINYYAADGMDSAGWYYVTEAFNVKGSLWSSMPESSVPQGFTYDDTYNVYRRTDSTYVRANEYTECIFEGGSSEYTLGNIYHISGDTPESDGFEYDYGMHLFKKEVSGNWSYIKPTSFVYCTYNWNDVNIAQDNGIWKYCTVNYTQQYVYQTNWETGERISYEPTNPLGASIGTMSSDGQPIYSETISYGGDYSNTVYFAGSVTSKIVDLASGEPSNTDYSGTPSLEDGLIYYDSTNNKYVMSGGVETHYYDVSTGAEYNGSLTGFSYSGIKLTALEDMTRMFAGCINIKHVNLSTNVTTDFIATGAFKSCYELRELDLSGWQIHELSFEGEVDDNGGHLFSSAYATEDGVPTDEINVIITDQNNVYIHGVPEWHVVDEYQYITDEIYNGSTVGFEEITYPTGVYMKEDQGQQVYIMETEPNVWYYAQYVYDQYGGHYQPTEQEFSGSQDGFEPILEHTGIYAKDGESVRIAPVTVYYVYTRDGDTFTPTSKVYGLLGNDKPLDNDFEEVVGHEGYYARSAFDTMLWMLNEYGQYDDMTFSDSNITLKVVNN